ncbi:MAG: FHA domain-containing protein [Chloroflexi bacterium]|nr:FHA domain-containing protein [Chloroflexota bacterium]
MSEQRLVSSNGPGGVEATGRLSMLSGEQQGREYPLQQRVITIGRSANNDIVISDPQTSRRHLEIQREGNGYVAIDAGSANGFYVNDQQVKRAALRHGDIISIGLVRMAFLWQTPPIAKTHLISNQSINQPTMVPASNQPAFSPPPTPPTENPAGLENITLKMNATTVIGREPGLNDVVLDNPQVSRQHFQIVSQGGGAASHINTTSHISDLRSTNGTYVNGRRISETPVELNDGDIILAGPYRFMFRHGFLYRNQDDESVRVDVLGVNKRVAGGTTLLQNVTFTILPREFVAIVGGSGTGKSTLLDAISGVRPATGGGVLYNRSDYYTQMEAYSSIIGYVPQDDIVPAELTVYKALYYAARLRLPQDTTPQEIEARLEEVMDDLGLTSRRDVPIHRLSGGQRKRVSIGAELLSKPSLFFLDEPTSGLDPGLEGRMMLLLRKLADQGRTVILITHATQNVELCDQVLFLARGGYVAFYGTPTEALAYFGVSRFSEIYIKLESERTPEEWANSFQASSYYHHNVATRLHAIAAQAAEYGVGLNETLPATPSGQGPMVTFRRVTKQQHGIAQLWRQFGLLTARYWETLISDRKYLAILLLQAPLIALMLILVFSRSDLNLASGDFAKAKTLMFLLAIVSIWFGTSNSAREIVKESAIYRRERRIGLKLLPYILSKLTVQGFLVLVQIVTLLLIVWAGLGLGQNSLETLFYIFLTLMLTALAGVTLGLLISALTSNSDRATSFVPVALIPQIIFGGAIVSLEKMGPVGSFISHFMATKWGYYATGTLTNLDSIPSPRLRFNGPPPEQATQIERLFNGGIKYETPDWYLIPTRDADFNVAVTFQWEMLGLIMAVSLVLIFVFQWRKDRNR